MKLYCRAGCLAYTWLALVLCSRPKKRSAGQSTKAMAVAPHALHLTWSLEPSAIKNLVDPAMRRQQGEARAGDTTICASHAPALLSTISEPCLAFLLDRTRGKEPDVLMVTSPQFFLITRLILISVTPSPPVEAKLVSQSLPCSFRPNIQA